MKAGVVMMLVLVARALAHVEIEVEEGAGRNSPSFVLGPSNLRSSQAEGNIHEFVKHGSNVVAYILGISSFESVYGYYNKLTTVTEQQGHAVNELLKNSEDTINLIATKLGGGAFDLMVLCAAILISILLIWQFRFILAVIFNGLLYAAYIGIGSKVMVGYSIGVVLLIYHLLALCAGYPVWAAMTILTLSLAQCFLWPSFRRHFWPSQTDRLKLQAKTLEDRLQSIEERLGSLVEMLIDQSIQQEQVMDICERLERRVHCGESSEEEEDDDDDTNED